VTGRVKWQAAITSSALVLAAGATAAYLSATREVDRPIDSVALGGLVHARVVLPPGYDSSGRRYPVVYFLHGLPATSTSYQGNDWLIDALDQAGRAILVMPQGARDADTDPEYLDWGKNRKWATYVSTELPRYVDAHFRTIPKRSARAIVGISAGGYGAMMLGLNHLDAFAVIESWSGYFHPTDPTGTRALNRGGQAVVRSLIPQLRRELPRLPAFIGFYVGSGDQRFRAENQQLDRELRVARVPHTFDVYPGAHMTSLWQRHATAWLRLALNRLAKPA
jgi:S-formylglutathione hydrolase FrmB